MGKGMRMTRPTGKRHGMGATRSGAKKSTTPNMAQEIDRLVRIVRARDQELGDQLDALRSIRLEVDRLEQVVWDRHSALSWAERARQAGVTPAAVRKRITALDDRLGALSRGGSGGSPDTAPQ